MLELRKTFFTMYFFQRFSLPVSFADDVVIEKDCYFRSLSFPFVYCNVVIFIKNPYLILNIRILVTFIKDPYLILNIRIHKFIT